VDPAEVFFDKYLSTLYHSIERNDGDWDVRKPEKRGYSY
jgi:hypothetical protein